MSLRYTRRLNKAARNVDATEQKLEASKALQKTIAEQIAAQEAELAHRKQVLQRIRSEQPQARDAERLREDFKTAKSVEERFLEAFANSCTPDGGMDGFQMREDVSELMAELAAKVKSRVQLVANAPRLTGAKYFKLDENGTDSEGDGDYGRRLRHRPTGHGSYWCSPGLSGCGCSPGIRPGIERSCASCPCYTCNH